MTLAAKGQPEILRCLARPCAFPNTTDGARGQIGTPQQMLGIRYKCLARLEYYLGSHRVMSRVVGLLDTILDTMSHILTLRSMIRFSNRGTRGVYFQLTNHKGLTQYTSSALPYSTSSCKLDLVEQARSNLHQRN